MASNGRGGGRGSSHRGGRGVGESRGGRGRRGGGGDPPVQLYRKVLVRNLPPDATQELTLARLSDVIQVSESRCWRFVPGKSCHGKREDVPARLYLDCGSDAAFAKRLVTSVHGMPFEKARDTSRKIEAVFSPYQKIPRNNPKPDPKAGTLEDDPEYQRMLEELQQPKEKHPSAETMLDTPEAGADDRPVAALVQYLNERRPSARRKKSASKQSEKPKRQYKKKERAGKDKSNAPKKERSPSSESVSSQGVASEKPKGKKNSPDDSREPLQPGMLRIMTNKNSDAKEAEGPDDRPPRAGGRGDATRGRRPPRPNAGGRKGARGDKKKATPTSKHADG